MHWLKFKYVFFFLLFLMRKSHVCGCWLMPCAYFGKHADNCSGGSWSGWNLYFRWRHSRRLEHGHLWYIMMDLQPFFLKMYSNGWTVLSSRKAAVSVFFPSGVSPSGVGWRVRGIERWWGGAEAHSWLHCHGIGTLEFRAELCGLWERPGFWVENVRT